MLLKKIKAVVTDLKPIYTAINEEQGYQRLLEFEENGKDVPFKL
jgi:transposase-like protein